MDSPSGLLGVAGRRGMGRSAGDMELGHGIGTWAPLFHEPHPSGMEAEDSSTEGIVCSQSLPSPTSQGHGRFIEFCFLTGACVAWVTKHVPCRHSPPFLLRSTMRGQEGFPGFFPLQVGVECMQLAVYRDWGVRGTELTANNRVSLIGRDCGRRRFLH